MVPGMPSPIGRREAPVLPTDEHDPERTADERGDDAYNLDLSDRRAKAVMKYLLDKGVEEKRMTAQGYGETQPLDRRHIEAAWAKNRRVAFLILKRASD